MNLQLAVLCGFLAGAAISGLSRRQPPHPLDAPNASALPPPQPPAPPKAQPSLEEETITPVAVPEESQTIAIGSGLAAEDKALNIDRSRPFVVATQFDSDLRVGQLRVQLAIVHAPEIQFKDKGFRSSSRHGYVERKIETGGYTLLG